MHADSVLGDNLVPVADRLDIAAHHHESELKIKTGITSFDIGTGLAVARDWVRTLGSRWLGTDHQRDDNYSS
jgi:hypothetical protein